MTLRRSMLQMAGDVALGRTPTEVVAHAAGVPALTDVS
jgi:hypothetical protein